jgi:PD-(D/E)XK nuclease superfamily/UvrD-like helicase C-terminal domain
MDLHIYRNAQDRWHDLRSLSRERGAVLAVNALTIAELVEKLTPDARLATIGQQWFLVRHVAGAASTRYALEAITELQSCSPPDGIGDAGISPLPLQMLKAYRHALQSEGLVDAVDRCWLASSRIAAKATPWLQGFQRAVLHTLYDLTEAEFELIRNLIAALPDGATVVLFNHTANVKPTQFAEWTWQRFIKDESLAERTFPEFCRPSSPNSPLIERLFVFEELPEPLDVLPSLRLVQTSGRYREIEFIGSEIAGLLDRGEDASEIAVVVRHIETYGELIEDVFSRYAIPHTFATGVPLLRVPFIKYWFALLDLATSERSRDALTRVLASAYFEPRLSPGIDVERELETCGYIDRHHLSAPDLARRRNSPITIALQQLETLLDRVESCSGTVSGFISMLQPPPVLTSRDRQAWQLLSEEIHSVSELEKCQEMSFPEFRAIASEIASVRTIDRLSGSAVAPGLAPVRVVGPRSLGSREYRWIFAPGLADGEFPAPSADNPLLPESLVDAINAAIRPGRLLNLRDRHRREPLYLFMMLDSAARRVTLTYPGWTIEGEPLIPSIHIGEIARHFASSPVEHLDWELPVREPGECLRKIADASRRGLVDDRATRSLLGDDVVKRIALEKLGCERGDIGIMALDTSRAWHPSELNALAGCPFVFLARHQLQLRAAAAPEFEVPVTEIGKLAHDVLREFYETPIPTSEASARERMDQIIRRRLADSDISGQGPFSVFDPSLWKIRRAQLVAALHQYVRFAVKDALDGYQTLTEYLGDPLPRAALGPVSLAGRPDHVAIRRIGNRVEGIRVDDFKYSAASSGMSRLLKDSFQVPIYAWLAARALNADASTQIEGRYLLLKSPSTPVVSCPIDGNIFDGLQSRVTALVERVHLGRLHPEPVDRQQCSSCDYRRLCRLYGE